MVGSDGCVAGCVADASSNGHLSTSIYLSSPAGGYDVSVYHLAERAEEVGADADL